MTLGPLRERNPGATARRITAVRFVVPVLVLVASGVAACGDPNVTGSDAEVGAIPRLFRHDPAPAVDGDQALIAGTLRYDVEHGCFLVENEGLAYPVVPRGDEEIRFQLSAAHTPQDIACVLEALPSPEPDSPGLQPR